MLLTVSSCSILVTAYLGYYSGQSNLTERAFSQLTSLRSSKAYQIESYFRNIRNHIETLSQTPSLVATLEEFTTAYQQLETVEISPELTAKLNQYYQQEFISRISKLEPGNPVLSMFLPQTKSATYLQYHYIAANPYPVGKKETLDAAKDGSNYSQIHARYHPIFRRIIDKFGYYDLFLIDPQGNIVYTVYKETSHAINGENKPACQWSSKLDR
jgi:hypothetical protein